MQKNMDIKNNWENLRKSYNIDPTLKLVSYSIGHVVNYAEFLEEKIEEIEKRKQK